MPWKVEKSLIYTAVNIEEIGYIQGRLIKAVENINFRYDGTVHNSVIQILQFSYGEDGIDATSQEDQTL